MVDGIGGAAGAAIEKADGLAVDLVDSPVVEIGGCASGGDRGIDQLDGSGGSGVLGIVPDEEPIVSVHCGGGDHHSDRAIVDNPGGGGAEDVDEDVAEVNRIVLEALGDSLGIRNDASGREDLFGTAGVNLENIGGGDAGGDGCREQGAGGSSGAVGDVVAGHPAELRFEFRQAARGDDATNAAAADRENVSHGLCYPGAILPLNSRASWCVRG